MALTDEQIQKIENTIKESLRNKFSTYKPVVRQCKKTFDL